jgi:hypothetical protein
MVGRVIRGMLFLIKIDGLINPTSHLYRIVTRVTLKKQTAVSERFIYP